MSKDFISHKLIKPNSIEFREYQVSLANDAKNQNSLVVLPTGLGKTTIALQVIADYLSHAKGGVLFLAPTRVLVNQHYEFLKENVLLDDIGITEKTNSTGTKRTIGARLNIFLSAVEGTISSLPIILIISAIGVNKPKGPHLLGPNLDWILASKRRSNHTVKAPVITTIFITRNDIKTAEVKNTIHEGKLGINV